jgi:hypothetical protein
VKSWLALDRVEEAEELTLEEGDECKVAIRGSVDVIRAAIAIVDAVARAVGADSEAEECQKHA